MNIDKAVFINSDCLSKNVTFTVSKINSSIGNAVACNWSCSHQFSEIDSVNKHVWIDWSATISAILFELDVHVIGIEKSIYVDSICKAVISRWVRSLFAVNIRVPPGIYRYDLIISISPKFPILAPRAQWWIPKPFCIVGIVKAWTILTASIWATDWGRKAYRSVIRIIVPLQWSVFILY